MPALTNRKERHIAACGSKPGGASAYYYKESCIPRDRTPNKGAQTRRVMDTHIGRLEKLARAASDIQANILRTMDGKRVSTTYSSDSIDNITNITLAECLSKTRSTLEKSFEQAVGEYNRKRKSEKAASLTASLLYRVCERLEAVAVSAILAARASKVASKLK